MYNNCYRMAWLANCLDMFTISYLTIGWNSPGFFCTHNTFNTQICFISKNLVVGEINLLRPVSIHRLRPNPSASNNNCKRDIAPIFPVSLTISISISFFSSNCKLTKFLQWPTRLISWIFIVLFHWNNSPRICMPLHSDTLAWFWANQLLLFLLIGACLAEKQTNTNLIVFGLTRSGFVPMIYRIRGEHDNYYIQIHFFFNIFFL
jgi:hypothetical protein